MKFEVGKKYQFKGMGRAVPFPSEECIAVTDELAWLKPVNGRGSVVDRIHDGWREIKEPRSISPIFMNIFVNMSVPTEIWLSATPHKSRNDAIRYARTFCGGTTLVDTIEVTYTEKV